MIDRRDSERNLRVADGGMRNVAMALAIAVHLAGCAVKRDVYVTPEVPVPNQFRQSTLGTTQLPVPTPPSQTPVEDAMGANVKFVDEMLAQWWRVLGSKELDALVDQAMANNADLRVATLRIVQAKARFEQARADELPVVTVPFEARAEAPAGGVGSVAAGQEVISRRLYQGSLRGDWRVDVWGERRALAESSQLQLWRSIYQRDDTRRGLVATLVSQYVEYLSLNDRLRVARETEVVLRGMLEAVAGRLKGGDATITDLEQQRAAVYSVQATIPGLELQRENSINGIAATIGATPGSLSLSHRGMDSLAFPRVLPGVPANLLLRRPDVRVVEARLLAADADIDVARARLLPSIDLTSQIGYGSLVFSRLIAPQNLAWNLIGNLSATIFDYGKRGNEVNFARALHEELVETYVRVLYAAIRETEDAIATVQLNAKRLDAQGAAVRAAKRAWDFSVEAYREGAIDYLTLLDTERTYHRNLDEYHRISMERHKGLVSLFSSLGGGVPKNAPAPSRGDPPGDLFGGDYATRISAQGPIQFHPVDTGPDARMFWLVELAGLQDRVGVTHVWRDLINRFPELMSDRVVLPRMQGRVTSGTEERTAWYRIFIARFPTPETASAYCDRLKAALIRCQALRSDSPAFLEPGDVRLQEASAPTDASGAIPAGAVDEAPSRTKPRPVRGPGMTSTPLLTDPHEARALEKSELAIRPPPPTAPAKVLSLPAPANPAPGMVQTRTAPFATSSERVEREPPGQTEIRASLAPKATIEQGHGTTPQPAAVPPQSSASTRIGFAVQLATLYSQVDAEAVAKAWLRKGYKPYVYQSVSAKGGMQYTVRTGVYASKQEAAAHAARIRGTEQVFAVSVPVSLDETGQPAAAAATQAR